MKKQGTVSALAGFALFILAALFSVALAGSYFDFGAENMLITGGKFLFAAYGFSVVLIPCFLIAAGVQCFVSSWSRKNGIVLLGSFLPFFTVAIAERVIRSFLENPEDPLFTVKLALAAVCGVLLVVVEYLVLSLIGDAADGKEDEDDDEESEKIETVKSEKIKKTNVQIEKIIKKEEKVSEESDFNEDFEEEHKVDMENSPFKNIFDSQDKFSSDDIERESDGFAEKTFSNVAKGDDDTDDFSMEAAIHETPFYNDEAAPFEDEFEEPEIIEPENFEDEKNDIFGNNSQEEFVEPEPEYIEDESLNFDEPVKAESSGDDDTLIETSVNFTDEVAEEDEEAMIEVQNAAERENTDDPLYYEPEELKEKDFEEDCEELTEESPLTDEYNPMFDDDFKSSEKAESEKTLVDTDNAGVEEVSEEDEVEEFETEEFEETPAEPVPVVNHYEAEQEEAIFEEEEEIPESFEDDVEEDEDSGAVSFDELENPEDLTFEEPETEAVAEVENGDDTLDDNFFDIDLNAETDEEKAEIEAENKQRRDLLEKKSFLETQELLKEDTNEPILGTEPAQTMDDIFAEMSMDAAVAPASGEPLMDLEDGEIDRPHKVEVDPAEDVLDGEIDPEMDVDDDFDPDAAFEGIEEPEEDITPEDLEQFENENDALLADFEDEVADADELNEFFSDDEPEEVEAEPEESPAMDALISDTSKKASIVATQQEVEHVKKPRKSYANYKIPTDILDVYPDQDYKEIDEATKRAAQDLKETLEEFKIEAEITGIQKGPVVTMFEMLPAPGVKLSKIVALQDNIALRLAAKSVRIVAPIPGKRAVGIEVPNAERAIVGFKEIIEQNIPQWKKMAIPVILGKDISGEGKIIDLAKTPHLLIAGSTGAGKSVCVNSLILSILYKRSPAQCKLILIDPKIVELKLYNDIPHLLTPVITEPKRAMQALQYCLCEMERRYAMLDGMGCRDIESYNTRIVERKIAQEKLPYIVVIIDEFADLMATTGKEMESTVARLCAMSRAVGIHLVLATQRPSVDVITGLIKANIPSRVAFMVAAKMDSRIIIDQVGAEKLLGKGDMLYSSAADPNPIRIQGTFISDNEVENVVDCVKEFGGPDYIDDDLIFSDEDEGDDESNPSLFGEGEDPLYDQALQIVVQAGKASASYIQRRLKIGYNRAARLVEEMEARGLVGPQNGSKPREIIHMP